MTSLSRLFAVAALGLLPVLAACDQAAAPAAGGTVTPAAGVGNRFDGRYVGQAVLTSTGRGACGVAVQQRSMTVQNGVAQMVGGNTQQTIRGPVQPDGSVTLSGANTIRGRFENGTFTGTQQSQNCTRTFNLTRQAPQA